VVVDGRFLLAPPTGLHRVARQFVTAARNAGADLEVWAPAGTADPLVDREVRVPGGRPNGRWSGRFWEQVVLPSAAHGRQILSLTNTAPLLNPGVVLIHDIAATVGPQWFAGSMRLYARTVLASARRADHVVTVSQAVADDLATAGIRPARLSVVPPAVDEVFAPAGDDVVAALRQRLGLERTYVVAVGWADPRKDVATAAAAHLQVVTDRPHDLVLVGRPHPTFAPVTIPAAPSIKPVGRLDDADLIALLTGAEVLLYPSRYEGFGLPPLEAQACGTPAVASDIPAIRESSAGTVRLEPVGDVAAWADALRAGLSGRLSCASPPSRRWAAAGQQLADAIAAASDG
jgi:glycosyltransferase involved in cell wall biosynthesis